VLVVRWLIRLDEVNDCCLTDDTDVLYNKFNVGYSSPPDNPPQHPNSEYNCVVATTGQWRVSRCTEQHHVVCQSNTLPGIMTPSHSFLYLLSLVCDGVSTRISRLRSPSFTLNTKKYSEKLKILSTHSITYYLLLKYFIVKWFCGLYTLISFHLAMLLAVDVILYHTVFLRSIGDLSL